MVIKALDTLHPFYGMSRDEQADYIASLEGAQKDKLRESVMFWEQKVLPKMQELEQAGN